MSTYPLPQFQIFMAIDKYRAVFIVYSDDRLPSPPITDKTVENKLNINYYYFFLLIQSNNLPMHVTFFRE